MNKLLTKWSHARLSKNQGMIGRMINRIRKHEVKPLWEKKHNVLTEAMVLKVIYPENKQALGPSPGFSISQVDTDPRLQGGNKAPDKKETSRNSNARFFVIHQHGSVV